MTTEVLEVPAQAIDDETPEAPQGTDALDVTVQAGENTDEPDDEIEEDAPTYTKATLDAEVERRLAEEKRELERATREAEKAQRQKEAREALKNHFPATVRGIRQDVSMFYVQNEDGEFRQVGEADIQPILNRVNTFNERALDASHLAVMADWETEINQLLSDEKDDYWKAVNPNGEGVPVAAALDELVRRRALKSDVVKDADPQALIDANSKLKAFHAKEKDEAYARGLKRGRNEPPGAREDSSVQQTAITRNAAWLRSLTPEQLATQTTAEERARIWLAEASGR